MSKKRSKKKAKKREEKKEMKEFYAVSARMYKIYGHDHDDDDVIEDVD